MKKMTEKSLSEAFAGESMAHMKYLIFAEVAEESGNPKLARLFRAIAYAEFVHAKNHARNLGYIGDNVENLKAAMEGENFEVTEMYPAYMAIAQLQEETGAQRSIRYAEEAEKIHYAMYGAALKNAENGKDADADEVYVCPVCGYTHIGIPPDKCPVCGADSSKFAKF